MFQQKVLVMKKSILFFVAISLMIIATIRPFTSFAQQKAEPDHFRLGLKTGVNFDKTQGEHLNSDFSGYFFGGIYVGFQSKRIRLQAEALFSQNNITTGAGFKDAFQKYLSEKGKELESGTFKTDELSIPLIFGYNLIPNAIWIEAGPQYTDVASIKDLDGFVNNAKQVVKKGYVSGLVGLSVELPLNFNLSVRYVFGLSNRNNTDVPVSWKSDHIQAAVGFTFF